MGELDGEKGDNSISPLPQKRNEGRLKGRDYYLYKTGQGFTQKKQIKIGENIYKQGM